MFFSTPLITIITIISLIIPIITLIPSKDNHNITEVDIYNIFNNLLMKSMEGHYYTNKPSRETSLIQNKLFQFFSRKSGTGELKLFFLKGKSVVMNFIIADGDFRNNFASLTQTINLQDITSAYTNNEIDYHLYIPTKKTMSYIKQFRSILLRKSYKQEYISIALNILNSQQLIKATIEIESIVSEKLKKEFTIEFQLYINTLKSKTSHNIYISFYIINTLFHLLSICYMIYLGHTRRINFKGISFLFIHIDMIWNAIQCILISNISSYLEFNTKAYGAVAIIYFILFGFAQSYLVYLMRKTQETSCKQLIHLFIFEFFASIFIFLYSFYYTFWKYLVHLIFPTTFLPQIFHNISYKIKNREIPIVALISFMMNKLFLVINCMMIPYNSFKIKPEAFPVVYGIGIHCVQIIFLFIQWNYGYDFYLPRYMKNSIERYYKTYREALSDHPNILNDRCSICLGELIITPPGDNNNNNNKKISTKAHKTKEKDKNSSQIIKSQSQNYKEKIIGKDYNNVSMREMENQIDTASNDASNNNNTSNVTCCTTSNINQIEDMITSSNISPPISITTSTSIPTSVSLSVVNNQQQEIEQHEIITVHKSKFAVMKEICLNCVKNKANKHYLVFTPCQHFFHPRCIEDWWKTKKECPFCRHALPSFDSDSTTHINNDIDNEDDFY